MPAIHEISSTNRRCRIFFFGQRRSTLIGISPGEVPFDVVARAYNINRPGCRALPVILFDKEVRTLMFMAVPFYLLGTTRISFCLFELGDAGIEQAVIIPFLPYPSWDGVWSYLDIAFGFLKTRGNRYRLEVGECCLQESDDISWLPVGCHVRLTSERRSTQIALPPLAGSAFAWPETEDMFVRWFQSEHTIVKAAMCRRRQLCYACGRRVSDVDCKKYIGLAKQGTLGQHCADTCGDVSHLIRPSVSSKTQYEIQIPMCIHPALISLYLGTLHAFGNDFVNFELLPGSSVGKPIWQEAAIVSGFSRKQSMSGDPCVDEEDAMGGSTECVATDYTVKHHEKDSSEPALRKFLATSEAANARLCRQLALERVHCRDECYHCIENGSDDSCLAADLMRLACGLQAQQKQVHEQDDASTAAVLAGNTHDNKRWDADDFDGIGGSLPLDVVRDITLFHFSPAHLRTLASTCRALKEAVRDSSRWQNRVLYLEGDEFHDRSVINSILPICNIASAASVRCRQLCLFSTMPQNIYVSMPVQRMRLPGNVGTDILGFHSIGPMMGRATFDLILPASTCGIYMGVKEWRGIKKSYCRIDNLFRSNTTWSYGLNGEMPRPHYGRERHQIRADTVHNFALEWSSHCFEVSLDNVGVTRITTSANGIEMAPPLAEVFVWLYRRTHADDFQPSFRSKPSPLSHTATVKCSICAQTRCITATRWRVCPTCSTWMCHRHVLHHPDQLCPFCPAQLQDALGGSSDYLSVTVSAAAKLESDKSPYVHAGTYYKKMQWHLQSDCKFHGVINKILRKHADVWNNMPEALYLLPDPDEKISMAKRQWEQVLHRARIILDLLHQGQDVVLYHFIYDQARRLRPDLGDTFLHCPHPTSFSSSEEWRRVALRCALEIHVSLAEARCEHAARVLQKVAASQSIATWHCRMYKF